MKTIYVEDIDERQIREDDEIFYAGPLVPLLYSNMRTSGPSIAAGLVVGKISTRTMNYSGLCTFNFIPAKQQTDLYFYTTKKNWLTLDFHGNISFPIKHFSERTKEMANVFHVDEIKNTAYFTLPHVRFLNTIDFRAGLDRDFRHMLIDDKQLVKQVKGTNVFSDLSTLHVNQVNYSMKIGLSFRRNSNYHSKIIMDDKVYKSTLTILQELYLDARFGVYNQLPTVRTSNGNELSLDSYLHKSFVGFELGFKHIYGGSKSVVPNISLAIGSTPGYRYNLLDGAYIRTMITICYSRHTIKDALY